MLTFVPTTPQLRKPHQSHTTSLQIKMRFSLAVPALTALACSVSGWTIAMYDTTADQAINNYVSLPISALLPDKHRANLLPVLHRRLQ
jgi:ABC-type sulfate transport system permease component